MDANKTSREKINGNYTRMLQVILNNIGGSILTKQQLYGHLPLIKKELSRSVEPDMQDTAQEVGMNS